MKNREKLIKKLNAAMETPPVSRGNLGPFVNGYIKSLFDTAVIIMPGAEWGEESEVELIGYTKNDFDEPSISQIMRDCLAFYWRNRYEFEALWVEEPDYGEFETGRDFWLSRNGKDGFNLRGFELVWDKLHHSASFGFGPVAYTLTVAGEIRQTFQEGEDDQ